MPTASLARLEKQASVDANDSLKQGIVIIEHKIRNLEKRKLKLDGYRDLQKSGKDLNSDQLEAISKYDIVIAHLDFAKELSKQLQGLASEMAKNMKKQARKEAAERAQQELAKTKEILIIHDVLANMGQHNVRMELVEGKSNVKLTEQELQAIDELYEELTPKKDEPMLYLDMFNTPADTLHHLMEGKNREAFGTTFSALKTKLLEIASSGYFDTATPAPEVEETPAPIPEVQPTQAPEEVSSSPPIETVPVAPIAVNPLPSQIPSQPIVSHTFQPSKGQPSMAPVHPADVDSSIVTVISGQGSHPQQMGAPYFTPSHLRAFQSATIDFMQENELDQPENVEAPPSAIPTMTFANQSFSSNEPQIAHIPTTPHQIDIQPQYQHKPEEEPTWNAGGGDTINVEQPPASAPPPVNAWTSLPSEPQPQQQQQPPAQNLGVAGDDDWVTDTDQWSQVQVNSSSSNDGFITPSSGRGRPGGRGRRGGGGDRNNKGGFNGGGAGGGSGPRSQGGRGGGGYRGGDGYNRDREGGHNRDREGGYNRDREGGYNRDREGGYNRDREGGYNRGGDGPGSGTFYKDQNNSGGYQNGYQNNRSNRGHAGGAPRQPQDRQGGGGGGGRSGGGNRGSRGGSRGGNQSGNSYKQ